MKGIRTLAGSLALGLGLALALPVGAAGPTAPKKTAWGTPTLSDWNGVWQRMQKPGEFDIIGLRIEPTPLYAPYLKANLEARAKGLESGHLVRCLPAGMPILASMVYPAEFIVRPDQVNIIYELGGDRRIVINGTHPDFIEPSYRGHSIGRWEGDTLVVDTVGITTRTVMAGGARHSNRLHIIERMHEVAPGVIENNIRLEDPMAFAKPVEYSVSYKKTPGVEVEEFACEKNFEADTLKINFDAFDVIPEPEQALVHWAEPRK